MNRFILFFIFLILHKSALWAQESILQQMQSEIQAVADRVMPAVVEIQCRKYKFHIVHRDDKNYFVRQGKSMNTDSGLGVILDREGHILTGDFVVGSQSILVKLFNGETLAAKIKGSDRQTGIALLKIAKDDLLAVEFAGVEQMKAGNFVIGFSHPYGLIKGFALGQVIATPAFVHGRLRLPISLVIYPGDKGAPVFDINGKLLAIVDGIIRGSEMKDNEQLNNFRGSALSLATPVHTLVPVIEVLKTKGQMTRGWLGVRVTTTTASLQAQLNLSHNKTGIVIENVMPGSPAEKAGLRKWDIIVKFDGKEIDDLDHFRRMVENSSDNISIHFFRNGRILEKTIKIENK